METFDQLIEKLEFGIEYLEWPCEERVNYKLYHDPYCSLRKVKLFEDGSVIWTYDGVIHNLKGPAVILSNGKRKFFIKGIEKSHEDWEFLRETRGNNLTTRIAILRFKLNKIFSHVCLEPNDLEFFQLTTFFFFAFYYFFGVCFIYFFSGNFLDQQVKVKIVQSSIWLFVLILYPIFFKIKYKNPNE